MRKNRFFFLMALIAILSLTACGGGDWEDDNPPLNTAKAASEAFPEADKVFGEDSTKNTPDLMWSRDDSIPEDRLVVRFDNRVIYDERYWFVYGYRGQMRSGTDVVIVQAYTGPSDSGRATLFVGGRHVALPDFRVDCGGTRCSATLRDVRELDGGFLLGWASYKPLGSEAIPASYAWMLYHPRTGFMLNLGEYCAACSRR